MLSSSLAEVSAELIGRACREKWSESETLDFKRDLPSSSGDGRREFPKDVAAMANASGGDLVYGVQDEDGRAGGVVPLIGESADAAILRLRQMVESAIEPRLPSIQFKAVDVDGGYLLVVRVQASFLGPHAIKNGVDRRFVMRAGTGTSDLSFDQLRSAFDRTASLGEMARRFVHGRLDAIAAKESMRALEPLPLAVVHFVPLSGLARRQAPDLHELRQHGSLQVVKGFGGCTYTFNVDGLLVFVGAAEEKQTAAYWQFFRDGSVEAAFVLGEKWKPRTGVSGLTIWPDRMSKYFYGQISRLLAMARSSGFAGPAIIGAALLDVKGCELHLDGMPHYQRAISDRPCLVPQEVWIENLESADPDKIARPLLDVLWQGFGRDRCPHFERETGAFGLPM